MTLKTGLLLFGLIIFFVIGIYIDTNKSKCKLRAAQYKCTCSYNVVSGCKLINCQSTGSTILDALIRNARIK